MAVNSYALTNLDRQKDFLGISGSEYDTVLTRLINSATDAIESFCGGRRFKKTAYTQEVYNGSGSDKMILKNWPIVDTEDVTLQFRTTLENRDEWQTEQSKNYMVHYDSGILQYIGGTKFIKLPRHWRVSYTAGWDFNTTTTFLSDESIGEGDLEYACWSLVKDYYEKKNRSGDIRSESIGNYSVTFGATIRQDPEIKGILTQYARPQAF